MASIFSHGVRPPSVREIAKRLNSPLPSPVAHRGVNVRAMFSLADEIPVGRAYGLGGFGASGGGTALVADIRFAKEVSARDFFGPYGQSGDCDARSGGWQGVDQNVLAAADARLAEWDALAATGDTKAAAFVGAWKSKVRGLVSAIDKNEAHDCFLCRCGRSPEQEERYTNAMRDLGSEIRVMASTAPKNLAAAEVGAAKEGQKSFQKSSKLTVEEPGLPAWVLPVGLGVGGLLLIAILAKAKKKSSATATTASTPASTVKP